MTVTDRQFESHVSAKYPNKERRTNKSYFPVNRYKPDNIFRCAHANQKTISLVQTTTVLPFISSKYLKLYRKDWHALTHQIPARKFAFEVLFAFPGALGKWNNGRNMFSIIVELFFLSSSLNGSGYNAMLASMVCTPQIVLICYLEYLMIYSAFLAILVFAFRHRARARAQGVLVPFSHSVYSALHLGRSVDPLIPTENFLYIRIGAQRADGILSPNLKRYETCFLLHS